MVFKNLIQVVSVSGSEVIKRPMDASEPPEVEEMMIDILLNNIH